MIVLLVILFAVLGASAGAVHFVAISRDAALLVHGRSALAASGWRMGRVALTLAVLVVAAQQGWPMLLAATGSFMAARQIILRRLGTV